MKDLGDVSFVLSIQIHRNRSRGTLGSSQKGYIEKVFKRYGMQDYKSGDTPMVKRDKVNPIQCPKNYFEKNNMQKIPYALALWSLMYIQVCTRPDFAYIVMMLSRYLSNLGIDHLKATKQILWYLQKIKELHAHISEVRSA
ncbi:hypothetical protein LguiA_013642 [Lonicera macranthoides]